MKQNVHTVLPRADVALGRFHRALKRIMRVSKADLREMLVEEEAAKRNRPKPGPRPKRTVSEA